ncbi:catechol 2,3-dioxygenase-like lactoylglutathione lyase family enzyme [Peribacillus deserti]|uniref:Catechol 2,3-dioxygenase-like lactoylglutathione lyase family enzyme n=1 Tax=Peribacillus deserti TaxID=673318 RepID=A0ABS2QJV2_9BACI|nr:VOC family protein [Peribacillus deserti]MBM7693426.1 catechol 2,3-dioxygenase-like lactoylglutathione lyase family enzyme [Peribacillus deserti]
MFSFEGIDHVQLAAPADCEKEARLFYGGILGMEELPKPESLSPSGCWFRCGNQEIHIGVEEFFSPAKKAHPALVVANLDELEQHLSKNGVKIKADKPIAGRKRFFINDPFGNRVEFLEFITVEK